MLFPTATFAVFFVLVLPVVVAPDATRPPVAAVHHRVELRLLRVVGLALRLPARRLHRVEPAARRAHRTHVGSRPAEGTAHARPRREPRGARLLQVLRLLRQLDRQPPRRRRPGRAARAALDRAAGRHQLLHVHGDQLRGGHLPRRDRADDAREVRGLPLVLPAPRRRPDRPARRADSRSSTRRATRAVSTRAAPST